MTPAGAGGSPELYLRLVAMAAIWGGLYSVGRVLAPLLPPLTSGTLRFIVATAILVPLVIVREGRLPALDRRQLAAVVALAVTGVFLFNALFFAGLERVSASRAALITALNPALTAIAMWLVYRERLRALQWLGIALALAGVAVVLSHGDVASLFGGAIGAGDLMILGTAASWSAYTIIGRRVMGRVSALAMTAYSAAIGTPILALGAVLEQPWPALAGLPLRGWLAVAYAGVLATVLAFLFFNEGVRRIGPSRAAIFINLVPVFGVAIAVTLLGEPLFASILAGGAMAVGGVMLANLAGAPARS